MFTLAFQVLRPGTDEWVEHLLPIKPLPKSNVVLGSNGLNIGMVANGKRVLLCGGGDSVNALLDTCYYLEKNGLDVVVGGTRGGVDVACCGGAQQHVDMPRQHGGPDGWMDKRMSGCIDE